MIQNQNCYARLTLFCFLIVSMNFLLSGCKKTSGSGGGSFTISGVVNNESGSPVQGATIKIGNNTETSDAEGNFTMRNLSDQKTFQLEVSASSYFTQYRNIANPGGSSLYAPVSLLSKQTLGTIPAGGGSVSSGNFRVMSQAGSFKNADGSTYQGSVSVSYRYVQGTDSNLISKTMPGGDFMAKDLNGNDGVMLTYGFVGTEFTDAAGNKLTPDANVQIAVKMPNGGGNPVNDGAKSWGYDPTAGRWTNNTDIKQSGDEYFFPCTTLYQNLDINLLQFGTIRGHIACSGKPLANETITISSNNYRNKYITSTNDEGDFQATVAAKDGASINFLYNINSPIGSVYVGAIPPNTTTVAPDIQSTNCSSSPGTGSFMANGITYSGICTSVPDVGTGGALNNIDVAIITTAGDGFLIYNMPQQASGSYTFTDGWVTEGGSSLYALTTLLPVQFASVSGTVVKTGSNAFTFTCTMNDIDNEDTPGSGKQIIITGNGAY